MKAFVLRGYGSADMLELRELPRPEPGAGEVLVRVHATSVNPYDWHLMRGQPYVARLMAPGLGLRRPGVKILGADVAGQVAAVGPGVTRFRPGDEVFALLGQGGFGEYVCVPEAELAPKPGNLSYLQAAAVPLAASTALVALRDTGKLHSGQSVLVNGASGGVGTFAVQIAKALGATVTGVCRTSNMDMVRAIGADDVIDYTAEDFSRRGRRYDLLIDIAGTRSASACRRALTRKGTHVVVGGPGGRWLQPVGHIASVMVRGPFVPQRMAVTEVTGREHQPDLITLTSLIEAAKVTPVIDRCYPFLEIPDAVRYQEEGHSPGKVVISVAG